MISPSEKPKLYYFDVAGLGEAIRLTFTVGKIEFEDVRMSMEEWTSKYKAMSPSGKVPMLEIGGQKFVESNAILMYAARRANLVPDKPIALMTMWQAIFSLAEFRPHIQALYRMQEDEKASIVEEVTPKLTEALRKFASIVGPYQHQDGYLGGDRLTAADIVVYAVLKSLKSTRFGLKSDMCDVSPVLKKVYEVVDSLPEIQKYNAAC